MTSTKTELREKFLALRQALSAEDVEAKSEQLCQQAVAIIDWSTVHHIHCFLPLFGDNEPDMRALIEFALARQVEVYTSDPSPKTGRRVQKLENEELQDLLNQYEITEDRQFDLIIIPMIAYDPRTKQRLGFGGGFYDRLLPTQQHTFKLGVCFREFTAELPEESHDAPLDEVIFA